MEWELVMASPPAASRSTKRSNLLRDRLSRTSTDDLDVALPHSYAMSAASQDAARQRVEDLIARLQPGGLDDSNRDVLNNLINAWTDQQLAELDHDRDERLAVADALVGAAAAEVARYKPRYEADAARVTQATAVLADMYEQLTGRKATDQVAPRPRRSDDLPIESTLGPVDISDHRAVLREDTVLRDEYDEDAVRRDYDVAPRDDARRAER